LVPIEGNLRIYFSVFVWFAGPLSIFFPAVIDWDESTFILMGQSIIDGHLPYVKLWDLKPPGAFAFYAFFIARSNLSSKRRIKFA